MVVATCTPWCCTLTPDRSNLDLTPRNPTPSNHQVLAATSTLAAGVNLPARRVILRGITQGPSRLGRAQYLQMVGRAGRAGQAAIGEAFVLASGACARVHVCTCVCVLACAPCVCVCVCPGFLLRFLLPDP